MGDIDRKYTLHCRHHPVCENHGLLQMESFEGNVDLPAFVCADNPAEREQVLFEYIRLPNPTSVIQDDPALPGMQGLGYAGWADEFDLILYMSRFCAGLIQPEIHESEKLRVLIDDLEKTKFLKNKTVSD